MLNIHAYPETPSDVDAMAKAFTRQFGGGNIYDRAFVASENETFLNRLNESDPRVRLCNLCHQRQPNYMELALAAVPCEVLQPANANVTANFVSDAHAQGLKVNVFYADDEQEMQRLIDCGVDGILTNYPARLLNLISQLS